MTTPTTSSADTTTDSAGAVSVRPMEPGDAEPLRRVMRRAFDRFDQLLYTTRNRDVLVAVDQHGTVVGGVVLHATPGPDRPAPGGRLGIVHFVFADPDASLTGIGTALREAADRRFDELGCTETSARIDAVNSASQALHRAGGYRLASFGDQVRRWGWRLPRRWLAAGHGFDPGMQLWLRPAPGDPRRAARSTRFAATWALNLGLLAIVAWRAPRADAAPTTVLLTLALGALVVLGLREATIRTVAAMRGLDLEHAPWPNAIGLGAALAAAVGVWLPLTGSSTPQTPGWRHDIAVPHLGITHLAGGLAVAAIAWTTVLVEPTVTWLAWPELRRIAITLALVDLVVPISPMIGTTARHVQTWSTTAWAALAALGTSPLLVTMAAR
jgi:L-amino acid N-acyltransferase YncA